MTAHQYLLSLEGGGTRSQAALMDLDGRVLGNGMAGDVNTNFTPFEQARAAVVAAVEDALRAAGIGGEEVILFASALVGPKFGAETFGRMCPNARYAYYGEMEVVFARAGIYQPHGVGLVAATGATVMAVRADDGRRAVMGGWGALLGDEGSAYAMGLQGLRGAVRAYEHRAPAPTRLVEAVCEYFGMPLKDFHHGLIQLAYAKPLSRTEIAGVAAVVTRLAGEGDPLSQRIVAKVAGDLANLALNAARRIFTREDTFDVVVAGGLINAGEMVLAPLRQGLADEFPRAVIKIGSEQPAVALGRLALYRREMEEAQE